MGRYFLAILALGAVVFAANVRGDDHPLPQPTSPDAKDAIARRDAAVGKAREEFDKLAISADDQEVTDLEAAMKTATRGGDLAEADAIKAARDLALADAKARAGSPSGDSSGADTSSDNSASDSESVPPPKSFQARNAIARCQGATAKAQAAFCKAVIAADKQEAQDLQAPMRAATRAGDLAEADAIKVHRDAALADAARQEMLGVPRDLMPIMAGRFSQFRQGIFVLGPGDRISTKTKFTPPIAFHIVARTDSTNIRIGYAADQIIFNWENDRSQLRIGGGPADGKHKKGAGAVPVNEWVAIDLVVKPDSMTISVDGHQRYHIDADFSKIDQPLAIFQGSRSVVAVKAAQASLPR